MAQEYGYNKIDFAQRFNSDELKERVKKDFTYSQNIGVRSFPTVFLKKGDDLYLIVQGYDKAEAIIQKSRKIIGTKKVKQ